MMFVGRRGHPVDLDLPGARHIEIEHVAGQRPNRHRGIRRLHGRCHRSEEHTSELQSLVNLVCRLLLEKKNKNRTKKRKEIVHI